MSFDISACASGTVTFTKDTSTTVTTIWTPNVVLYCGLNHATGDIGELGMDGATWQAANSAPGLHGDRLQAGTSGQNRVEVSATVDQSEGTPGSFTLTHTEGTTAPASVTVHWLALNDSVERNTA